MDVLNAIATAVITIAVGGVVVWATRGRIDDLAAAMGDRFDDVNGRLDAVDRHFEAVDRRFDAVDRRFDAVDRRFERLELAVDGLRSDLTQVALAVGAKHPRAQNG
jgi:hypothetical protein